MPSIAESFQDLGEHWDLYRNLGRPVLRYGTVKGAEKEEMAGPRMAGVPPHRAPPGELPCLFRSKAAQRRTSVSPRFEVAHKTGIWFVPA